jgi:hypothetical protein
MSLDDIETALRNEPLIAPGSDFCARVMVGVRRQAVEREALPFPWSRLLPGLVACLAVVVVVAVFADPTPASFAFPLPILENPAVGQALGWIASSLLGTWLLVWMAMRFAGANR